MMGKSIVATALAATLLFASAQADAALMAYLTISGQKTGEVKGGIIQKGRENSIGIIAVEQASTAPFDLNSGVSRGANLNGPITISKELDQATPLLRKMMATNEIITKFDLKFWTPQTRAVTGVGSEIQHFTISLKNARIVGYKFHMLNIRNADLVKYNEYEDVTFAYDSISYTWTDGGITYSDTWVSPGR